MPGAIDEVWRRHRLELRAGIKARAMQLHLLTQLLDEETSTSSLEHHSRDLEHPADLAWNLFVGIYFKSGGFPWTPVGLTRRHLPSRHHLLPALRRGLCPPDISRSGFRRKRRSIRTAGQSLHLAGQVAAPASGRGVSARARRRRPIHNGDGTRARRVVVHKQSRFFEQEREGLEAALGDYEYHLVGLAPSLAVRAMRHGQYPAPRDACVAVGDRRFLYTTGYVPSLGRYPQGHVPTPVQIVDHVGDSSPEQLLRDVLILTKMNWNSARFAERLPVTVRFAKEVGAILRDLPDDYGAEARYAFYM